MDKYHSIIARALGVAAADIKDLQPLEKGMTNLSFLFTLGSKRYILRIPGEGTDKIIDRRNEFCVYGVLKGLGISENVVFFSPSCGYKISEYWDTARPCNPYDMADVRACMAFLRRFHEKDLCVAHSVDIFERIEFYESLLDVSSPFTDYMDTKNKIFKLKDVINGLPKKLSLAHMDAVPDNFLFMEGEVRLVDWEYAAMQDPHVDIAMFALHSLYGREQVDELTGCYFTEGCPEETRLKIYCYIAVCGLLCSNWCEYKKSFGADFGQYSLMQYQYAKEYFSLSFNLLKDSGDL